MDGQTGQNQYVSPLQRGDIIMAIKLQVLRETRDVIGFFKKILTFCFKTILKNERKLKNNNNAKT